MPARRKLLVIEFGRFDRAVGPVDRVVRGRQAEGGLLAVDLEGHLERRRRGGAPRAFGGDQCAVVIVVDRDDVVDAALGDETVDTVGCHGFRIAEHGGDEVRVMQMHVQQGAAGEFAVAEPILPMAVVDARRQTVEVGGAHLAVFARLVVHESVAIGRPCADAHVDVEELVAAFDGLFDLLRLLQIAAERLLGLDVFSSGQGGHDQVFMIRRRHADIDHVDVGVLNHVEAVRIDFDAREIERDGIVVVADVALHAGDVACALNRINIRDRNDLRVRHEIAVDSEMRAAHETETDQTDSDFVHHFLL